MTTPAAAPEIDGLIYVQHLGAGGYSDVYLYERRAPRMKIAVKVLKEGRLSPGQLTQFAAEAEAMAELADHPNIVQVFSTGTTARGRPYLVMKYYPPPNLGIRCARERFSVADTLRTGVKIAGAVETAHRAGILHRDIKPANILVSQYGEPGLTDFGIAGRAADTVDDDDLGVSIPWSPPEVLSGESNGSVQADVYSLAATLWHLLVGRSPFETPHGDNSQRALVARVLAGAPPSTGRADVPVAFERLLQQAMSKRVANRPRSALELARSLQAIEQELRFARTEIVTGELDSAQAVEPATAPAPSAPGEDSTRLRAPSRVDAQPAGPSRFAPPAKPAADRRAARPSVEPPTTARPARPVPAAPSGKSGADAPGGGGPRFAFDPGRSPRPASDTASDADAPPATVLRPSRAQPGLDEPALAPSRRGLKVKWVVLGASSVLVAAVVVGVVLTTRHAGTSRAGDAGHTPVPVNQLAGFDPPEQPVVTAQRDGTRVEFTWTYGNPEKGDYFLWTGSGGTPHKIAASTLTVPVSGASKACIAVQVVRTDGQASIASDKTCG